MRIWLQSILILSLACGSELTAEEADMISRVATSSDLSREELTDVMTMCEAMIDCYEDAEGCPDDVDIRRHMSRRPETDWGMIMVMEFKNKGIRPMEKELTTFLKEESLHRADWPCRAYYHEANLRKRKANRLP